MENDIKLKKVTEVNEMLDRIVFIKKDLKQNGLNDQFDRGMSYCVNFILGEIPKWIFGF